MGKLKKEKKERKEKKEKKEKKHKKEKKKKEKKRLVKELIVESKASNPSNLSANESMEEQPSVSSSMADMLQNQFAGDSSESPRMTPSQLRRKAIEEENERIYNERLINKPQPDDWVYTKPQTSAVHSADRGKEGAAGCSGTSSLNIEERHVRDDDLNQAAVNLMKAEMSGDSTKIARLKQNLENLRTAKEKGLRIRIKRKKPGPSTPSQPSLTRTSVEAMEGKFRPQVRASKSTPESSVDDLVRDVKRKSARDMAFEFTKMQAKMNLDDNFDTGGTEFSDSKDEKRKKKSKDASDDKESQSRADAGEGSSSKRKEDALTSKFCKLCYNNRPKHLVVSVGETCFMTLPTHASLVSGHCYIVPFRHVPSGCHLDDETWEEVLKFRQQLAKMMTKRHGSNCELVVIETALRVQKFPHAFFECIPVFDNEDIPFISAFFKKAFLEAGPKWSDNKKLLEFSSKKLKHAVPRGFSYVSVSFEMDDGKSFVHVIDDENLYPKYFLTEIIGGILDSDPLLWRNPPEENVHEQLKKASDFEETWTEFDLWEKN